MHASARGLNGYGCNKWPVTLLTSHSLRFDAARNLHSTHTTRCTATVSTRCPLSTGVTSTGVNPSHFSSYRVALVAVRLVVFVTAIISNAFCPLTTLQNGTLERVFAFPTQCLANGTHFQALPFELFRVVFVTAIGMLSVTATLLSLPS